MIDFIRVDVDGKETEYEAGTTYQDIAEAAQEAYPHRIVLARAGGKLQELHKYAKDGEKITFLTTRDKAGFDAYRRSCILLMLKAIYQVGGFENVDRVSVHYAVSEGLYVTMAGWSSVDAAFLSQVRDAMRQLVEDNLPIAKSSLGTEEAIELFGRLGMKDKERLFHYRRASRVNIYNLAGFKDYFYGYMVPSTGYLQCFELYPYDDGFVLQLAKQEQPETVPAFRPEEKIFRIQKESMEWSRMMNVRTVGDLNDRVVSGGMNELILTQEALFEKKIAEIAEKIASDRSKKLVMIAGPSSSGKTTFSHRLSIQLMAHGLKPHPIPMDNYFVEREDTPRDADGNFDFECLEALDIELFNRNMTDLLAGKAVELPTFNFKTGKKEYKGDVKQLGADDVLVLEGIHGLNDKLSYSLPKESKFKIYISALTQLNIDEHNRIPTTDGRLLRRIVRDARTRGASAQRTIAMWPSVRRGEESYIFPNQEQADVMINSAMIYEFAVLKLYAEPLLFGIEKSAPEYEEAKRLLKFLDYFVGIPSESIPMNSILREFVGGSCFNV
ncbi:MAG: nucleoside kinase [Eubacteriales bacterium]|nr:nucleoside kinase [Eubacteriales bacterium]